MALTEESTTQAFAASMQLHRSVFGVGGSGEAVASQVPELTGGQDCRAVFVGVYEALFVPVAETALIWLE